MIDVTDLMVLDQAFDKYVLPKKNSACHDPRSVAQVDVVLLDLSGSMSESAFDDASSGSITREGASVAFLCAFVERLTVHGYPHAVGLVAFADRVYVEPPTRALGVIRGWVTNLEELGQRANRGGATALREALDRALNAISDYRVSIGRPDLPARILALTDGTTTNLVPNSQSSRRVLASQT